jgi:hypothetical protein
MQLKAVELTNVRGQHEQAMTVRQARVKALEKEIEVIKEQIGKSEDAI